MPRPRITDQSDEPLPATDVDFEDVSALDNDQREEMDEILTELGDTPSDVRVHFQVHKIVPGTKFTDMCFKGTREEIGNIEERIRNEFGPGAYRVMIFKNSRLFKNQRLGIAAKIKTEIVQQENPELKALIDLLRERQTASPFGQMDLPGMITAGAALVTAFKGLFPPPPPVQQNSLKDTLDLLLVAREFGGANDKETSWTDLIAKFASPEMISALASMRGGQPALPQPNATLALPGPQNPQLQPMTPEQIQQAQLHQLKMQLDFMITRAQHNSDPALYADLLEDTLPPEFLAMLKQPGAMEFLERINPKIATYAPWFQAVLQTLAAPPIEDDDTNPEAGGSGSGSEHVFERRPASVETTRYPLGQQGNTGDIERDGEEGEGGEG